MKWKKSDNHNSILNAIFVFVSFQRPKMQKETNQANQRVNMKVSLINTDEIKNFLNFFVWKRINFFQVQVHLFHFESIARNANYS